MGKRVVQGSDKKVWKPLPWQIEPWKSTASTLLLSGSAGGGKALGIHTLIPTPDGLVEIGDIKEGDFVFDENFGRTRVIAVSEIFYDHECFDINLGDFGHIIADKNHLWETMSKSLGLISTGQIFGLITNPKTGGVNRLSPKLALKKVTPLRPKNAQNDVVIYTSAAHIKSITPVESVPVRCIQVEADSHSYLATEFFIVSHNSMLAAQKLHGFCLKYPGATALALRKTRESMTNSTVLFLQTEIIGSGNPHVVHVPTKRRFEYSNGSYLAYGGMKNDEQREQIRSIGARGGIDIAWMEEATSFDENDFNELIARMRGTAAPWTQIILTTNPGAQNHWIKKRLIDKGEAEVFLSRATDNIYNPVSYVNNLHKLTGILNLRLDKGLWVNAEGAVFEEFDQEAHVVQEDKVPSVFQVTIAAVDWGFVNPGVIQVWGLTSDNVAYLIHESYFTRRLIEQWVDMATEIKETYNPRVFVCDPAEPQNIELFKSRGLNAIKGNNNIFTGVQAIKRRLNATPPQIFFTTPAITDPLLEVEKLPLCTVDEMSLYVWNNSKLKDTPIDANNDGIDTARYAITYLDNMQSSFLAYVKERYSHEKQGGKPDQKSDSEAINWGVQEVARRVEDFTANV